MIALGIVLFAVGILLSVALHEIGHLVPAKKFNVHVPQYMVGFGPTLFSRTRGETEYGLKAIPAGGYVRLSGMYPPSKAGRRRGRLFDKVIEDARAAALAEVPPGSEHRAFYRLAPWRKLIVMSGGPAMNLVLGLVTLVISFGIIGAPRELTAPPVIASVSPCLATTTGTSGVCAPGATPSPARAAGLAPGDRIERVGTAAVTNWDQAAAAISAAAGPTSVTVRRDGRTRALSVDVRRTTVPDPADANRTVTRGLVGITRVNGAFAYDHSGPVGIARAYGQQIGATVTAIVHFPQRLVQIGELTFSNQPRGTDSPVGVVGASRFGGQVLAEHIPVRARVTFFLGIFASVNIALAIFNLVPLLPLDGGHIVGALWEALKKAVARLRHRPDPGHVDVARALPIAYAVTLVVLVSSVLLVYADVVNPVRLFG